MLTIDNRGLASYSACSPSCREICKISLCLVFIAHVICILGTEERTKNSRLPEGTLLKTGVLTQVMDIQEPLVTLRDLLEKVGYSVTKLQFTIFQIITIYKLRP